jgi:hypothetical protein
MSWLTPSVTALVGLIDVGSHDDDCVAALFVLHNA